MAEGFHDGNATFQPYENAMGLLATDDCKPLAFYHLPAETPKRRFGTTMETKMSDRPERDPAAVAMLGQVERFVGGRYDESQLRKA